MKELNSLPDSLRDQIREAAKSALTPTVAEDGTELNPMHQALLQLSLQRPELFASILMAALGFSGAEATETVEHSEDKAFEHQFAGRTWVDIEPIKTCHTVRRQIKLLPEPGARRSR